MSIIDRLNEEISIYDLFDLASPRVKYSTRLKPCQISCPFHGKDAHPSARVYPDTNSFRCFVCSKSWDVVGFWAEVNQYVKSDNSVDISRAIDELCTRYNITNNTLDWQKKFYALKKQSEEISETEISEKLSLKDYYSWKISNKLSTLPKTSRTGLQNQIFLMWASLDNIDLSIESWESDLKNWYEAAKIIVHV